LGAFLHEHLDEGPGGGRLLPWGGALARGQLDHDIADPARLAGLEHDVLGQVVALVQQANRRGTILDRGAVFAFDRRPPAGAADDSLGHLCGSGACGFVIPALASGQSQHRRQQRQDGQPLHPGQPSGDQDS